MRKNNQIGGLALALIEFFLVLALLGAIGFGWWAYSGRQDYKNRFNQKLNQELTKALADQKEQLQREFSEKEKSPYKTFQSSATYGSITFDYPKTWSAYVDQSGSSQLIDGYFFPDIVPSVNRSNSPVAFALRIELLNNDYAQEVKQLDSQISQGQLRASAYVPPKMVGVANVQTGTRFDGEIENDINGSMVIIRVRDKTLKVYTQSPKYLPDFDNVVLKTLTFVP
jgi:hypothetical protein